MSDTTLRARRDEWIAGVFEQLKDEALAAFDGIIGLDLDDVAFDGSVHKARYGGEGTGPNQACRYARSGASYEAPDLVLCGADDGTRTRDPHLGNETVAGCSRRRSAWWDVVVPSVLSQPGTDFGHKVAGGGHL